MTDSIKYIRSDISPILFKPPISPTDVSYIQFFYEGNPIIKFPYSLKIVFINTIENHENKAVFKSQIISHFVLYNLLTIEELHDTNLKTIDVLQKTLQGMENDFLKAHNIPVPSLDKTIDDIILNYESLCNLIIDIPIN